MLFGSTHLSTNVDSSRSSSIQVAKSSAFEKLCNGLDQGISCLKSSDSDEVVSFIRASKHIIDELNAHIERGKNVPLTISFDTYPAPLVIEKSAEGMMIKMGTEQKWLHYANFNQLLEGMCYDIQNNPADYGADLCLYADSMLRCRGSFPAYNKDRPDHSRAASFDKSQPYMTMSKNKRFEALNGEAKFQDGQEILCRHITTQFLKDSLADPDGKVDLDHYSSKENISQHIPKTVNAEYEVLKANAASYEFVQNDDFGQFIKRSFMDMEQKTQSHRAFAIKSDEHVMAMSLRIKGTVDAPIYVVRFHDANKTDVIVRCEVTNLSQLQTHTLARYINGATPQNQKWYEKYYGGAEPISLIMECDSSTFDNSRVGQEKKLNNLKGKKLTPTHMYYLLAENFSADLAKFDPYIRKIGEQSSSQLRELLAAKIKGSPGFYVALQEGHAGAIRRFTDYFKLVPYHERTQFLADIIQFEGISGIFMALQEGHADAINAIGEFLLLIPEEHRAQFLANATSEVATGLDMAMQSNHAAAIKAYANLLKLIPAHQRAALIASIGKSGLSLALAYGNTEAILAYREILKLIPAHDRARFIAAIKFDDGDTATHAAAAKGYSGAIRAYRELLDVISNPTERQQLLRHVLDTGMVHNFNFDLQEGHPITMATYFELFNLFCRLPEFPIAKVLSSCLGGMLVALQKGDAPTVEMFNSLTKLIKNEGEYIDLKCQITRCGTQALASAITEDFTDAVDAYRVMITA